MEDLRGRGQRCCCCCSAAGQDGHNGFRGAADGQRRLLAQLSCLCVGRRANETRMLEKVAYSMLAGVVDREWSTLGIIFRSERHGSNIPVPTSPMSQLESRWHYRTTSLCAWLTPLSRPTLAAASLICLYRPRPQPIRAFAWIQGLSLNRIVLFIVSPLTVVIFLLFPVVSLSRCFNPPTLCFCANRGFSTPSLLWNGFATLH